MDGNGLDMGADDYVIITGSDMEQNERLGVKLDVVDPIKKWLSPTEFNSDTSEYRKHLNAHVEGTGKWILDTKQFQRWAGTDEIGDLWIRGIPGSGKSVVAANLIRKFQSQGDAPVLFFFFRRIIMSNRTPQSLMRDFSFQLLDHSSSLQSGLRRMMEEHPNIADVPLDDLWKCLLSALLFMPKAYCVVDALDEMDLDQDAFLKDLLNLGRRNPKSIKLLLTSRQLPYLEAHLQGSCLVDLRLDRKNVDKDITTYISHHLEVCQADLTRTEADDIKHAVFERGKGLFLYARLMLTQCLQDPRKFVSKLQSLPDGLGDLYGDLLHEHAAISKTPQSFQKLILEWVIHAMRPLRLIELTAMVNSLPDRGGLEQGQDTKLAVRSACGPLLEICEDQVVQIIHHSFTEYLLNPEPSHVHMANKEARLFPVIHPISAHKNISRTALRYLGGECFKGWAVNDRSERNPTGVLLGPANIEPRHKDLMLRFHFLAYTAQYWPLHAAKVPGPDPELFKDLDTFFQGGTNRIESQAHNFESWKDFWTGLKTAIPIGLSPLHVAAYSGLSSYAQYLLTRRADLNVPDGFRRTPLMYAAMEGHDSVLDILLKAGSSYDCVDVSGRCPIHYAAEMNRATILRRLLSTGANPLEPTRPQKSLLHPYRNQDPRTVETPLSYCCQNGHVEALIELQHYLKPRDLWCDVLHLSASNGRAKVLKALLEFQEVQGHINDRDARGNTPLYLASYRRHPNAVRVLLEHKADVNVRSHAWKIPLGGLTRQVIRERQQKSNGLGYTPLHGWARMDRSLNDPWDETDEELFEVMELLLAAGCDINALDDQGCTVLFGWNWRGLLESSGRKALMVSQLLNHGAIASIKDAEGGAPLHRCHGHLSEKPVVSLLVHAGADINAARETDGRTPLMVAVKDYQLIDPTLFYEFGAEFDKQDHRGNTALHYACSSWCMEYKHAEMWISFTNPTIQNNRGRTAMTNFAWGGGGQGRVDSISLMMKKGLSLETRDYLGRTAILSFVGGKPSYKFEKFVEELVKLGADVKAKDYEGKTVLHLLAASQTSDIDYDNIDLDNKISFMKRLMDAGADLHALDHAGNSIFHDAALGLPGLWPASRCSLDAITKLGGGSAAPNFHGRTALHMAATVEDVGEFDGRLDFVLRPTLGLDVNAGDHHRVTALHLASSIADISVWKLVQAGANLEAKTLQGQTALHYAAKAGKPNVLDLLVDLYRERSLSLDCQDIAGHTPLHEAARSGKPESVRILLNAGATPSIRDRRSRTPLHASAEFEETPAARAEQRSYDLENHRANHQMKPFSDKESFEKMRLIISSENDNTNIREVVRLLLTAAPGNLAVLDNNGHTAMDIAIMLGTAAVVDELKLRMSKLYSSDNPLKDSSQLCSLDPFGELLSSSTNQCLKYLIEDVEFDENTTSLLERIICCGNDALVEEVVRTKQPQLVGPDGSSALHLAVRWGLCSIVDRLLPYVDDINAFAPPLLHTAVERAMPNTEMIKLLIKYGVDINAKYKKQERCSFTFPKPIVSAAIHILASGKHRWHSKALVELLEARADPDIKDTAGMVALQTALLPQSNKGVSPSGGFWSDQSLDALLKYGANINATSSKTGLTPLSTALESNRGIDILQKLLSHGADVSFGEKPAIASAIDSLDIASLTLLLKAGANPNIIYRVTKRKRSDSKPRLETPLQNAACWSNSLTTLGRDSLDTALLTRGPVIKLLLEYGADPYLPLEDGNSSVFHEICAVNGLVRPFLDAGVSLETKDSKGRTPLLRSCNLQTALYRHSIETEHAAIGLINNGADIHATDEMGMTALHYAVWCGLQDTTRLILDHGASVNAKNNTGLPPLYYAFVFKNPDYNRYIPLWKIEYLLDAGASPFYLAPDSKTPLHHLACCLMEFSSINGTDLYDEYRENGYPDYFSEYTNLYCRLVEAGCDSEARDGDGNTPLLAYVASVKHHNDMDDDTPLSAYVDSDKHYSDVDQANPLDPRDQRKMLAEHDIFVVNNDGDTLLHAVARREDQKCPNDAVSLFKILVELGLDPRKENNGQLTPLDVAAACGNDKILALYARND